MADPLVTFEDHHHENLLPLAYIRTVGELRCGRRTLCERISHQFGRPLSGAWTRPYMAAVAGEHFGVKINATAPPGTILANAAWLVTDRVEIPHAPVVGMIDDRIVFIHCDDVLASILTSAVCLNERALNSALDGIPRASVKGKVISYPWDLLHENVAMLQIDSAEHAGVEGNVYEGAQLVNASQIFVGEGARVKPCAVLDAEYGPIYIGKDAIISPNTVITGPCSIGEKTLIQPGANVGHGTSIGPVCKVGGEIEETIIHGYSNKQHDGFLGHAYIGEWVNLAADTVNSDLKNTYGTVRVPINGRDVDTGEMFVGVTVGDHAKTGITQAFGTGSVVGFASMVATSGYPPRFVPSFSWLTDEGQHPYDPERCLAVARKVMARRKRELSASEAELFLQIPALARRYEKIG
jgi:UDP-N-acetylglucosamine diphosphorylase/glucosamine-1-phosphate N-acetyltransferase